MKEPNPFSETSLEFKFGQHGNEAALNHFCDKEVYYRSCKRAKLFYSSLTPRANKIECFTMAKSFTFVLQYITFDICEEVSTFQVLHPKG